MRMISVRLSKKKGLLFLAILLLVVGLIFVMAFLDGAWKDPGGKNEQRVSFLRSCGWEVEPEPVETREIQIPETFSQVYKNYAQLNEKAGFHLEAVAGKKCMQYVYKVKNYDGRNDVYAHLLVCDGRISGGDLSTAALNGFMVPLRILAEKN
jgi:hypothetical protein